jgi:beta-carotene 3-hydroxylase
MLINLFWVVLAYCSMEFIAWFSHKYIMHGVLWKWHKDHHKPGLEKDGFFERNDLFFVVFAIPGAAAFILGSTVAALSFLFYVGIGISLYGLTYFLIHDVYIHQRFKWFRQLEGWYSKGVLKAHGAHHSKQSKEAGESFGLLIVHPKYFKKKRESSFKQQA